MPGPTCPWSPREPGLEIHSPGPEGPWGWGEVALFPAVFWGDKALNPAWGPWDSQSGPSCCPQFQHQLPGKMALCCPLEMGILVSPSHPESQRDPGSDRPGSLHPSGLDPWLQQHRAGVSKVRGVTDGCPWNGKVPGVHGCLEEAAGFLMETLGWESGNEGPGRAHTGMLTHACILTHTEGRALTRTQVFTHTHVHTHRDTPPQ